MRITSFVMGLGVGAAVTMLFAPRSGKETREVLCEKACETLPARPAKRRE